MFTEIKYQLFRIILTEKKKLILFSFLAFFGLFVVLQSADAFALDLASVQLDALDFVENIALRLLIFLALLLIESTALLLISANLFEWAAGLPVGLTDNQLITAGWGFTSGLVNVSFILIFIVIALSFILKIDTLGMKKALPRLIIIALLINFSLLFVKILVDVGWIFQNSFINIFFEEGFVASVMSPLTESGASLASGLLSIFAVYVPLSLIPYANVAGLFITAFLFFVSPVFFTPILQAIVITAFNLVAGISLLVYALLFLFRIAVIWLLAIAAPLAFLAFILPATQKYFSQWLKFLLQWVFLGVLMLFLLGLGIKFFAMVVPAGGEEFPIYLGEGGRYANWNFLNDFYKYIFLIVYLIVVLFISKKAIPMGTEAVWAVGEKGISKANQWTAGKTRKYGMPLYAAPKAAAAKLASALETKATQAKLPGGPKMGRGERATLWATRRMGGAAKLEAQAGLAQRRIIYEERARILSDKKMKDVDEAGKKAFLRDKIEAHKKGLLRGIFNPKEGAALGELGSEFNVLNDSDKKFIRAAFKTGGPDDIEKNPTKKAILKTMPHMADDLTKDPKTDLTEFGTLMSKIKAADIDKFSKDAKKSDQVVDYIVHSFQGTLINRLGEQSKEIQTAVQKKLDPILKNAWNTYQAPRDLPADAKLKAAAIKQLKLLRNFTLSPMASDLGWDTYGATAKEVEKRIKKLLGGTTTRTTSP